jgi:hypothetical protein
MARSPLKAADEQDFRLRMNCGCSCLEVEIDPSSRRFVMVTTAEDRSPYGYALPHSATVTVIIAVARFPESRGIVSFLRFNH